MYFCIKQSPGNRVDNPNSGDWNLLTDKQTRSTHVSHLPINL